MATNGVVCPPMLGEVRGLAEQGATDFTLERLYMGMCAYVHGCECHKSAAIFSFYRWYNILSVHLT